MSPHPPADDPPRPVGDLPTGADVLPLQHDDPLDDDDRLRDGGPLHDGGRDHTPQDDAAPDAGAPGGAGPAPWPQPASEDGRGVPLSLLDFLA